MWDCVLRWMGSIAQVIMIMSHALVQLPKLLNRTRHGWHGVSRILSLSRCQFEFSISFAYASVRLLCAVRAKLLLAFSIPFAYTFMRMRLLNTKTRLIEPHDMQSDIWQLFDPSRWHLSVALHIPMVSAMMGQQLSIVANPSGPADLPLDKETKQFVLFCMGLKRGESPHLTQ